jgi:hypothetical protein
VNAVLSNFNLKLDTLTKQRAERLRLADLEREGHFERPVFPLPAAIREMTPQPVLEILARYGERYPDFADPRANGVGYCFRNDYFSSPDAEVLYALVRHHRPATIVEVGSGHSTRLIRQAIADEGTRCKLLCIDPVPRVDIAGLADQVFRQPAESFGAHSLTDLLRPGDLLFIDSSHLLAPGGDVAVLYLEALPALVPGVLVHIHDVFLPYEYPRAWVVDNGWRWNEQYLVQAMLMFGRHLEVIWAGHYLQRTRPDFASHFPHTTPGVASSLWLRTMAP